ncbi:MAG: hypothetical protein COB85_09120 [Bacteroidetes bacterium]|nr:MAG: hypothetical protein COB85_09120 [Bacteroidota bacterium]
MADMILRLRLLVGRAPLLVLVFLFVSFSSCTLKSPSGQGEIVATVYAEHLYKSDIERDLSKVLRGEDSSIYVKNYIDNWVKERLMLNKAMLNLKQDEEIDIDRKLNDYKTSLIIYAYKKELLRQQLDTAISFDDILGVYEPNKKNFRLKNNIVRMLYIKVRKPVNGVREFRRLIASDNEEDRTSLSDYCQEYSTSFSLNDSNWVDFDQVIEKIPMEVVNQESFLRSKTYIEVEDSLSLYFLRITAYLLKDDISPVQYQVGNIRSTILNKRKLGLMRKLERNIYQDAKTNGDFTLY